MVKEYRTITDIAGPLIFVEKTEPVGFGELVNISLPDGTKKRGQVLDTSKNIVVVHEARFLTQARILSSFRSSKELSESTEHLVSRSLEKPLNYLSLKIC
jgi:vacuolar-type H+-ATPase subunit B/Vma2